MAEDLKISFQDEHLVVVEKPVGLITHKSGICTDRVTLMSLLRRQMGRWVYPIHRLDRATSGLVIFALSSTVAEALGRAMQQRQIGKSYLAVVRGHQLGAGTIDKALVSLRTGEEQLATTDFQCVATTEQPWAVRPYNTARYTLLRLTPLTGRTHQLRRHLKGVFHPIIGDTRYGDGAHNAAFRTHLEVQRLMLHAEWLQFRHPVDGRELTLTAPVDGEFLKVLQHFGWSVD